MIARIIIACLLITICAPAVWAQNILQGPAGDPADALQGCDDGGCTLAAGLVVTGDLLVDGAVTGYEIAWTGELVVAQGHPLSMDVLQVAESIVLPVCPDGYAPATDPQGLTVCQRSHGVNVDQVVRVGNHWVDRYEASLWQSPCAGVQVGSSLDDYPDTFPANANWTVPVYSCSTQGVMPASHGSWFQHQQACALAGKHLCSNAEWHAAAIGPPGPDGLAADDFCNTLPNLSGDPVVDSCGAVGNASNWECGHIAGGTGCRSTYGAFDMIGNLSEFVARWDEAGERCLVCGENPEHYDDNRGGFFRDGTWNLVGEATDGYGWPQGIPAALLRGGSNWDGCNAGFMAASQHTAAVVLGNERFAGRCCSSR